MIRHIHNISKVKIAVAFVLFSFACLEAVYLEWPSLINRYCVEWDVRTENYWMDAFHDPLLFRGNIYPDLFRYLMPYGYLSLYYLLTFFTNAVFAGKLISIAVFGASALSFYCLGKTILDKKTGIILFLLFVFYPIHFVDIVGGHARGFGYLLLALFLYFLIRRLSLGCFATMILMVLFYPPLVLVSFIAFVIQLVIDRKRFEVKNPSPLITVVSVPILAMLILSLKTKPVFVGELFSQNEMFSNPALRIGGAYAAFPLPMLQDVFLYKLSLYKSIALFIPLSFLAFMGVSGRFQKIGYEIVLCVCAFLLAGAASFVIAKLAYFNLYEPDRQIRHPLAIVIMVLGAIGLRQAFSVFRSKYLEMSALAVFFAFQGFLHAYGANQGINQTVNASRHADLFRFLESLPKQSMIAADPYLSDNIATFSRRNVFVSAMHSFEWYKGFTNIVRERTREYFSAAYSPSGKEIYGFSHRNNIDYIVVGVHQYDPEFVKRGRFFFEPYNQSIRKMLEGNKTYFLKSVKDESILFKNRTGEYFVIRADAKTLLS